MMDWPTELHLLRPLWLWALLPAVLIVGRLIALRLQNNFWNSHVDAHLLPHLLTGAQGKQSKGNLLLLSLGWMVGVIALAGPVWERLPSPSQRNESALVIVMDLSQSMNSRDVTPSRIEAAKKQLLGYLDQAQEGSIGLVLFAQQAYIGAPLSSDFSTVKDIVKHLDSSIVPVQGSRPEQGVTLALSLLQRGAAKAGQILLVTDGSHDPQALFDVSLKSSEMNYPLSVIGVGTEAGGVVPKGSNEGFVRTTLGSVARATLELETLSKTAEIGGGEFIQLQNQTVAWPEIIVSRGGGRDRSVDPKESADDAIIDRWQEFGLTLVYLLIPIVALGFRRGWLACCSLLLVAQFSGPIIGDANADTNTQESVSIQLQSKHQSKSNWYEINWRGWWVNEDLLAYRLYQQRRIEEASQTFKHSQWKAATLYRIGDFEQAEKLFESDLTAQGAFNYGNALAQQGKVPEAIAAYKMTLDLDVNFKDARFNLAVLEAYLKNKDAPKKKQQMGAPKPKPKRNPGPISSGENKGKKKDKPNQKKNLPENDASKEKRKQAKKIQQKPANKASKASDQKPPPQQQVKESEASSKAALYAERVVQDANQSVGPAQWLNMIEDKPNELLKLKYRFQYEAAGAEAKDHEKPW